MDVTKNTGHLRVSDAEREPVVERLQEAFAEGRLEHDEFEQRMHLAMTARTRDDLAAVQVGLPGAPETANARADESCAVVRNAGETTSEDRLLGAAAHALGIPTLFVGPLILRYTGKRSEFVKRHAAEAVNFQLTLLLITLVTFGFAGFLYSVAWIVAVVAAVIALSGQDLRTPFVLRILR